MIRFVTIVAIVVLALLLPSEGHASAPPVPGWTDADVDWQYFDANGTALGHYHFYWWSVPQVTRWQAFNFNGQPIPDSIIYFSNYSAASRLMWTVTFNYASGSCCINNQPTAVTFENVSDEMGFVLPLPSYSGEPVYSGPRTVDGFDVDSWQIEWADDKKRVLMHIHTNPRTGETIPIRTSLPHNGRYLRYNEWTTQPADYNTWYSADLANWESQCTHADNCCSGGICGAAAEGPRTALRALFK
jgi:hypothetical protein